MTKEEFKTEMKNKISEIEESLENAMSILRDKLEDNYDDELAEAIDYLEIAYKNLG